MQGWPEGWWPSAGQSRRRWRRLAGALTVLGSGEADRLEVHPEGPAGGWLQRAAVSAAGQATGTWWQSADGRRWRGSGRGGRLRQPGGG